jgi:hypothetical protein
VVNATTLDPPRTFGVRWLCRSVADHSTAAEPPALPPKNCAIAQTAVGRHPEERPSRRRTSLRCQLLAWSKIEERSFAPLRMTAKNGFASGHRTATADHSCHRPPAVARHPEERLSRRRISTMLPHRDRCDDRSDKDAFRSRTGRSVTG